jgi:hypothetical protein
MGNQNRLIFIPMRLKNIFNEATASEIVKDLDKVKNDLIKKVDVLIAKKKKLYSDVDITTPMSADEKQLDKDIQSIFSQIQQIIQQKRKIKESVNEKNDDDFTDYLSSRKSSSSSTTWKVIEKDGKYSLESDYKSGRVRLMYNGKQIAAGVIDWSTGGYEIEHSSWKNKEKPFQFAKDVIKYFKSNKLTTESVNEDKYYIGYNKGRGQGTGVFKDVFSTYKDAKKELEKIEKQRGGSYNQIAYYVADKDGKFVRESINEEDNKSPEEILRGLKEMAMGDLERIEDYAEMISDRMKEGQELSSWMYSQITLAVDQLNSVHDAMDGKDGVKESVNEGREVKAIQSDFNKTVAAIETELLHYKKTKGTPQEKKHVDNLKKLHPIKKKLEAELESAVSGLYRDAELKIED